jgi:hypothetical protein
MKKTGQIMASSAACLAAALLLVSCGTSRRSIRLPAEPVVTVEQGGITMTLRFLDEPSLQQRFGKTENPFLTDYYRVMFRRNVVFDLTIRNQGPESFAFVLGDCELQYGGKTLGPLNRFQLSSDVDTKDEDPRVKAPKKRLINKYILPNRATLPSDGTMRGFLLFQGNLPTSGQALVTIPGKEGEPPFRFPYTF